MYFGGLTNFKTKTPLHAHVRSPVFKSNQFSFVPNRKGKIFRQDVLWSPDPGALLPMAVLVSNFPQSRGRDLFWIYALDFRGVFACYCSLHRWGVFTGFCSNFLWMVVVGLGSPSLSVEREPYEEAKHKRDGEAVDVRNNFSCARSGTSFQWWTRRRWLCENLKYANSV